MMRISCWNCGHVFRATKKGAPAAPALRTSETERPQHDPEWNRCPRCVAVVNVSSGHARLVKKGADDAV